MAELFFEIRSGEIPARMQSPALTDLKRILEDQLKALHLDYTHIQIYISPQRLVAVVDGLPLKQPDRLEERKGPRSDAQQAALDGFMKSTGKSLDQLEMRETPKGKFYFDIFSLTGRLLSDLIPDLIHTVIKQMPWPKNMTWGTSQQTWVRPLLGGCCVFNGQAVPFSLALSNLDSSDSSISFDGTTVGHRFLAPQSFEVNCFEDYKQKLKQAFVIVDQEERQRMILKQLQNLCEQYQLTYQEDPNLCEEVTGLIEWPVVYIGRIESYFMSLPPELLSTVMKVHQRYFTLRDLKGEFAPYFAIVANIPGSDKGRTLIAGNEQVLRARFSDATFYYHHDLRDSLQVHARNLDAVVFHAQLGSMADKAYRLAELASKLTSDPSEKNKLMKAAELCKADLVTNLVREFPELQGIIGAYYAKESGCEGDIGQAIYEQYTPRGPLDPLPTTKLSLLLALADRIDTLTGFFSIGIKPTGSKDPYALRRAALGVIRILEHHFSYSLKDLFKAAYQLYEKSKDFEGFYRDMETFFTDRLKVYWRDQGYPYDHINAILARGLTHPLQILKSHLVSLYDFLKDPQGEGANLLVGYRRASNIVRIEAEKAKTIFEDLPDQTLFENEQEHHLFSALQKTDWQTSQYKESLLALAKLRPFIDRFFDHVTVNAEHSQIRLNRLNLLAYLKRTIEGVADFSQIEGE